MNDQLPEAETIASLYHRAFSEYRTQAFWNVRYIEEPTPGDALAITKALRTHGGMSGRQLADQIEKQCGVKRRGAGNAPH